MSVSTDKDKTYHHVEVEFDGFGIVTELRCSAPDDALCHTEWHCDCDEWDEVLTDEVGRYHTVSHEWWDDGLNQGEGGWAGDEQKHYGTPNPQQCAYAEEFGWSGTEALQGTVVLPVVPQWEGDYNVFYIQEGK